MKTSFAMLLVAVVAPAWFGCAPSPVDALQEIAVATEQSRKGPDESLMDLLEPGSRVTLLRQTLMGQVGDTLLRLRTAVKGAKPAADMSTLMSSGDPATSLFLVRDGHSYRLDLRLSGLTLSGLREVRYPSPW